MIGRNCVSQGSAVTTGAALRLVVALVAFALMLHGCAHQVRLNDLQQPPADGPRRNLVFEPPNGQVKSSYHPWQGDLLVVRIASGSVSGCGDFQSTSQAIVSADLVVGRNGAQESLALTDRAVSELRLSTVVPSQTPPYVQIATESRGNIRLDLRPFDGAMNWGDYRTALDATCHKFGLMLDIIPVERAFAHPGDEIVVTRQSLISDAFAFDAATHTETLRLARVSGAGTRDVERFELTVDSGGAVYLPLITRLSSFEIYVPGGGKLIAPRAYVNALLAPGNSRLVVTHLPLTTLAACLSIAEVASTQKDCAGLDARYAPSNGDGGARREISYTIEPGRRFWSLIDQQGRRITLPYRYGMTVLEAVRTVYRGRSGHELPGPRSAYLTVVPRAGSGEPPFFAALGASDGMERILLEPEDTVHLTAWMPRRATPEGSAQ